MLSKWEAFKFPFPYNLVQTKLLPNVKLQLRAASLLKRGSKSFPYGLNLDLASSGRISNFFLRDLKRLVNFSLYLLFLKRCLLDHIIVSNIQLLLNYCVRFYDRQFITRENVNKGILQRFEELLTDYFGSDKPKEIGLPSVNYCADQLNLSANYFGDLIKKETGKSAQEYIQLKTMDVAKEKIFDTSKSVSEIAYELGFKYPQHFTRSFKQHTGFTPNDYRMLN
jgi:AraC-like DNA-binding protein